MPQTSREAPGDIALQSLTGMGGDDNIATENGRYRDPLLDTLPQPILQPMAAVWSQRPSLRRVKDFFRPAILTRSKPQSLRSTAYLDGLRGIAAFIVYVAHSESWNHGPDALQYGFGYAGNYAFVTFPFIRVFFTGGASAVAVFFVISGAVLSRRPLSLIHRQSEEVYAALSSAVFRRAIRLYFPFIAVTVGFFTMWHLFRFEVEWPKPQPNYFQEVVHWWDEFSLYVNPFKYPSYIWFTYDFPLWTIPVEFQGSILVFITLLSFARLSVKARISLTSAMALYFLNIGVWQMFCFLSGLLISEVDLLLVAKRISLPAKIEAHKFKFFSLIFIMALYLLNQPSLDIPLIAAGTPGWTFLTLHVPKTYIDQQWHRFWPAIAAPIFVFTLSQLPSARRMFESRFPQYLGRISFALYLVHIPVQVTFGDIVFRTIGFIRPGTPETFWDGWFAVPKAGPLGLELDFLLPQLFILPVTLYVSELATKLIDEPSVVLGRWAYERVVEW